MILLMERMNQKPEWGRQRTEMALGVTQDKLNPEVTR